MLAGYPQDGQGRQRNAGGSQEKVVHPEAHSEVIQVRVQYEQRSTESLTNSKWPCVKCVVVITVNID